MDTNRSPGIGLSVALAATGLTLPLAVYVFISEQTSWLLRHAPYLLGFLPSGLLGGSADSRLLPLSLGLTEIALLALVTHRFPRSGTVASLTLGTLSALYLHVLSLV